MGLSHLELFPHVLRLTKIDGWSVAAEEGALVDGEGKDVPSELNVVL